MRAAVVTIVILGGLAIARQTSPRSVAGQPAADNAEARAVAFLAREVPRWRREHPCYSCHNNGDAARALITAARRGHAVGAALDDTLDWLGQPARWGDSPGKGGVDDKALARIQFAGAARLAVAAGRLPARVIEEAAAILAAHQKADGSWQLDSSQSLGSPATYGTTLATAAARRTLGAATRPDVREAIAKADNWLRALEIETVLDAAAVVLALEHAGDDRARAQRTRALEIVRRGQAPGGGCGPYVSSAPDVFDTALVLLALQELPPDPSLADPTFSAAERTAAIAGGRAFLIAQQIADGSWPETTRPANQESYAQRISTTGWALLALLETGGER